MPNRAFPVRIFPTDEQAEMFSQWLGASRFVYNCALEQRRDWWRQYQAQCGRPLGWVAQSREVTEARTQIPWLAEIPRSILEYALKDLDRAFVSFFRTGRFPGFRSKETSHSFRVRGALCSLRSLNKKWANLRLPKCGWLKARITRAIPETINSITISRDARGWFAVFSCACDPRVTPGVEGMVGIDRGVVASLCLSNGEMHQLPTSLADKHRRRVLAQRQLARCKKGSKRRAKAKIALARRHADAANSRKHWLHERSTDIARRFGAVALEKLATANMTRAGTGKRGLNRSILNQGWAIFASMLEYKLADRGGELFYVNPAYTSQTCSDCGSVNAENRKSQAVFECVDCGHRAHADVNAAINILRRSPAGVEGSGCGPVEARPGRMLTHLENLAA